MSLFGGIKSAVKKATKTVAKVATKPVAKVASQVQKTVQNTTKAVTKGTPFEGIGTALTKLSIKDPVKSATNVVKAAAPVVLAAAATGGLSTLADTAKAAAQKGVTSLQGQAQTAFAGVAAKATTIAANPLAAAASAFGGVATQPKPSQASPQNSLASAMSTGTSASPKSPVTAKQEALAGVTQEKPQIVKSSDLVAQQKQAPSGGIVEAILKLFGLA